MKAIVVDEPKHASLHTDVAEFQLRPDYIRIKVHAVALNPTDWKHIDRISDAGAIVGCDVAGVVVEIGSDVTTPVKTGDRVAAAVHGSNVSNHEDGGFAERCLAKDGLFFHIPSHLSFEQAASLPVGVGTVGQGLYQSLRLPQPTTNGSKPSPTTTSSSPPISPTKTAVLIYGGSSATGTLAIQFASLSGLRVFTTASSRNHDLLRSLGAEQCFDYHDEDCGAQIRAATDDRLRFAFDCITDEQSAKICSEALSSSSGHTTSSHDDDEKTASARTLDSSAAQGLHYSALLPVKNFPREDVQSRYTMLYQAIGERYTKMNRTVEPDPAQYEFIRGWYRLAGELLADEKIHPHPIEVGRGFEGILAGLDEMRKGEYSAKKLVYTLVN